MKIKITKYELVEREVEIELPFYGHKFDSMDISPFGWDIYVKIESDGSLTTLAIKKDDGDTSFDLKVHEKDLNKAVATYGDYDRITENEFSGAIGRAQEALKRYG